MTSRAEQARIEARAGGTRQQQPPTEESPYKIIAANFDIAFDQIEALSRRVATIEASKADRQITSYHVDADNRLLIELADGSREIVGRVAP